ncbi:ATP-binding cassette domain-containing protein [Tessaracoccus sp. OS52]|uniref:ATP-binding cassette domain-containing protein n=1 Tax=Tessaracoccus sp. OS52 TaxID=2886691 RepID=UPI001D1099F6|nr:ATP-binding cassette domain-containing protein [Tessaracoccus sp. OS52]MCC2593939.1 ATP-binding cassette domain-containing protein [Tessaracoccus sp. OS52]
MRPAIEAVSVARLYGRDGAEVGLKDLSLSVPQGQVLALLGHNGAGKTTAVRGLTTLLAFDRGTARVAGYDVRTQPQEVRQHISLVGQLTTVDEQLSAADNLELFGRLRGLARGAARGRATELVRQFGLTDAGNRPVRDFSGGMRRRLDVAASMIVRPDVLFVDEPTTGLDPAARRDLWQTLRGLVAEGTTILLTTQYLEEADALADHVVLLAHGSVAAEGTPDDLKDALGRSRITLRFADLNQAQHARAVLSAVALDADLEDTALALGADHSGSLLECLRRLDEHGLSPIEVALRKPSLDEVFLSVTETPDHPEEPK